MRKRQAQSIVHYIRHEGQWHPMVQFAMMAGGRRTQVRAYVDSGAHYSLFTPRVSAALGIDYRTGQLTQVRGVDGSLIPVYLHRVTILIGQWRISALVGFTDRLGVGFNLLGRRDVFRAIAFTFNDRHRFLALDDANRIPAHLRARSPR